jgi:hypothetical protein
MGGSYRQCGACGKRALSIATRCPACGRELSGPVTRDPSRSRGLGRFLSPRVAGGLIGAAALLILAATQLTRPGGTPEQQHPSYTSSAAAQLAPAATPAPPPDSTGAQILIARTWTNVRASRSTRADVEAVLLPRDTVFADALERGWYRVALEGKVLGYVHRSTLTR